MLPKSAEGLHRNLLQTVMAAPLSFFTATDTGEITNRFSQDMSIVDTELPYSFIDLVLSGITCIMGAVLMCLSAGYFCSGHASCSPHDVGAAEVLSENITTDAHT